MKLTIHAGHNPDGKISCGAVGFMKESTENRNVVKYLKEYLERGGHTVYDCTVNNGTSQQDILSKIMKKVNSYKTDMDISIHFNAMAKGEEKPDGKTKGVEVFVYSKDSVVMDEAVRVCSEVAKLGFTNRGVKIRDGLYVLRKSKNPNTSMLIECCFVDDFEDVALYKADKMAGAIYRGLTCSEPKEVDNSELPKIKNYKGVSIVDGLKRNGYPSSFSYRKEIWNKLYPKVVYKGTAQQNRTLLSKLKE